MKKALFVSLGFLFFGLGALGAFLPVMPTTPFLLLSAACFSHGSARFQHWFVHTKLYRRHLESFVKERAMLLKTKIGLCTLATSMLVLTFVTVDSILVRIIIIGLLIFLYYYFIFRIKTLV